MPAIGLTGAPLPVSGRVRAITDGEFVITGPMYTGIRTFLGRTAVLDTGRAQIVVTERAHEPMDLGVFTHCGIDPRRKRFIMLKSRIHYRAGFKPIAAHIVECAGAGVTNADLVGVSLPEAQAADLATRRRRACVIPPTARCRRRVRCVIACPRDE